VSNAAPARCIIITIEETNMNTRARTLLHASSLLRLSAAAADACRKLHEHEHVRSRRVVRAAGVSRQ